MGGSTGRLGVFCGLHSVLDTVIHKISRQGLCWDLYRDRKQYTVHTVEHLGITYTDCHCLWVVRHSAWVRLGLLWDAGYVLVRCCCEQSREFYDRIRTYYSIPTSSLNPKPQTLSVQMWLGHLGLV